MERARFPLAAAAVGALTARSMLIDGEIATAEFIAYRSIE
jgi:hypothetical protein